ncbi:hypothetical protein GDO86_009224 [Hymenochirus boettgeri]|uniref:EGF-like domain-containing protein n=1 Tax=Hymenochirus boettgeri TaxID=247094 RepID=A0A8T2JJR4_9PIPI|nr:hypothetical protein GDO86_009224 [Hymenochirus boettgeri]
MEKWIKLPPDFKRTFMVAFVPERSCHVQFKNRFGAFSPPVHSGNEHLWCNWTIIAGPGKHIVIYIKGFQVEESCEDNWDKIIFEGVSSSVETMVIYACWNKNTHVFATQATAVHIVFFWLNFSLNKSKKYFEGSFYIFDDPGTSAWFPNIINNVSNGSLPVLTTSVKEKPIQNSSVQPFVIKELNEMHSISLSSIKESANMHRVEELHNSRATKILISIKPTEVIPQSHRMLYSAELLNESYTELLHHNSLLSLNIKQSQTVSVSESSHSFLASEHNILFRDLVKYLIQSYDKYTFGQTMTFTKPTPDINVQMSSFKPVCCPTAEQHSKKITLGYAVSRGINLNDLILNLSDQSHRSLHDTKVAQQESNAPTFVLQRTASTLSLFPTDHLKLMPTSNLEIEHNMAISLERAESFLSTTFFIACSNIDAFEKSNSIDRSTSSTFQSDISEYTMSVLANEQSNILFGNLFTHSLLLYVENTFVQSLSFAQSTPYTHFSLSSCCHTEDQHKTISSSVELNDSSTISWEMDPTQLFYETPPEKSRIALGEFLNGQLSTRIPMNFGDLSHGSLDQTKAALQETIVHSSVLQVMSMTEELLTTIDHYKTIPTSKLEVEENLTIGLEPVVGSLSTPLLINHYKLDTFEKVNSINRLMAISFQSDILQQGANLQTSDIPKLSESVFFTPLSNSHFLRSNLFNGPNLQISHNVGPKKKYDSLAPSGESITGELLREATSLLSFGTEESKLKSTQDIQINTPLKFDLSPSNEILKLSSSFTKLLNLGEQANFLEIMSDPWNFEIGSSKLKADYLFAVTAEIKLNRLLPRELEKYLVKWLKHFILHRTQDNQTVKENHTIQTFWLHVKNDHGDIGRLINTQLETIGNMTVGNWSTILVSILAKDVDECMMEIHQCDIQALCTNTPGTYSCQCRDGYMDNSLAKLGTMCVISRTSGIPVLYVRIEVLIVSIVGVAVVLVIIIAIVISLIQRRYAKGNFSLGKTNPTSSNLRSPYVDHYPQRNVDHDLPTTKRLSTQCAPELPGTSELSASLQRTRITVEQTAC